MKNPDTEPSRRSVLESIGVIGATGLIGTGTASAVAEADDVRRFGDVQTDARLDRTVQIQATGRAQYTIGVTGLLAAEDAPQSAVSDGVASETITDETHTFRFTGEFTEFSIDGNARVRVDGESFDVDSFPHNTLEIAPSEEVTYDVSASGAVSIDKGAADQPNVRTATARTSDTHVVSYAGELTYFQIDGDATIRRNGSRVDVTDVLPSTRPHEFTAVARSEDAYTIDITRDSRTRNGVSVETGEAARFTGRTVGRYAGQVAAVEHPSGTRVEIDDMRNEIVARAPADEDAQVSVETTKGLVVDHEAFDSADFSLSAGQEATAVPFGDVVRIVIDDLEVQLSRNAYPAAEDSAALQAAAKVERTDAFQRLADIASGRVRHDAAGIAGEEVLSGTTTTVRSVEHQLADSPKGNSGVVSVRQTPSGIEHASVRYKQFKNGREVKIDTVILPIARGTDKLRRETKTMTVSPSDSRVDSADVDYTAELFANTANPAKKVDSSDLGDLEDQVTREDLTTQGFMSFLNDVKDLLLDIGADVYDTAQFLWGIFKGQLDKVAITAQNIVISSPELIASVAENLPSADLSVKAKLAWRINIAPAVGLASLASAGFFDALNTGAWCAGCVLLAIAVRDVLASESAVYACFYFAPAVPAAVACTVAMELIIQFGSQYFGYSDVQNELCDGDVVSAIDPC